MLECFHGCLGDIFEPAYLGRVFGEQYYRFLPPGLFDGTHEPMKYKSCAY
jgi:hypothetical protein